MNRPMHRGVVQGLGIKLKAAQALQLSHLGEQMRIVVDAVI